MEPAYWGVRGFTDGDRRAAVVALQLGCQSLLQTLEVLDRYCSLERAERLAELEEARVAILTESAAAGG